ncbi:hypothetical protein TNCV_618951 [Trichonephila clavipes]|nr:hypothetical protein TNCV_618951 [Trichonephila clavipes]
MTGERPCLIKWLVLGVACSVKEGRLQGDEDRSGRLSTSTNEIKKKIHSSCFYEEIAISKFASTGKTQKSSLLKLYNGESDVNALG